MSNILNTEEEVRNFISSSPVEDVDPSAHLFVAVIKERFEIMIQRMATNQISDWFKV